MNDIDFLPIEYLQRHQRRQSQPWQIIVAAAVVLLVAAAAVVQRHHLSRAERDLATIAPAYDAAVNLQQRLGEESKRLEVERATAELYTFFRHPWPRSQLLTALTNNLPDGVAFQQVQILRESLPPTPGAAKPAADAKTEEERLNALPPAQRDLELYRELTNRTRVAVMLSGTSQDGPVLHRYLSGLDASDIFDQADLDSLSSVKEKTGGDVIQFRAVLAVVPGYGQPGGPQPKENFARANNAENPTGAKP